MRTRIIILTVGALLLSGCQQGQPVKARSYWSPPSSDAVSQRPSEPGYLPLAQGGLAMAQVEQALYRLPDQDAFYVRVRLTNLTGREIAVDLRDDSSVIRPGPWSLDGTGPSWGLQTTGVERLTSDRRSELLDAYRAGRLTTLPPLASLEYFRQADIGSPRQINRSSAHLMAIHMEGRLLLTDGDRVEALSCPSDSQTGTDFVTTLPISWLQIPDGSLIIERGGPRVLAP